MGQEEEAGGQRLTVMFNAADMRLIKKECKKRERELGYSVGFSDVLRELVRGLSA